MRRLFSMLIGVTLAIGLVVVVSGHEGKPNTPAGEVPAGSVTVRQTFPVSASVTVDVNGEVYLLTVPAMISVDTQVLLANAVVSSSNSSRVGVLDWVILGIDEYTNEYVYSKYQSYSSESVDNKLIVVSSKITNLDIKPFENWRGIDSVEGFDAAGSRYEYSEKLCDDVNPGATEACTFVFDVPKTVAIIGLDLAVIDRKSIRFGQ